MLVTIGGVWQHPLADQLRMNTPSTNAATKKMATMIPAPQRNFFNFPSPLFLECPYQCSCDKDPKHRQAQVFECELYHLRSPFDGPEYPGDSRHTQSHPDTQKHLSACHGPPPGSGMLSGRLGAGNDGFLMKTMKLTNANSPMAIENILYPTLADSIAKTASPMATKRYNTESLPFREAGAGTGCPMPVMGSLSLASPRHPCSGHGNRHRAGDMAERIRQDLNLQPEA